MIEEDANNEITEIPQPPPEEGGPLIVSVANAQFIENNAASMGVDELAQCTGLNKDAIETYLIALAENSSTGVDITKVFNLIISMDKDGNISYGMRLPRIRNLHEHVDNIAKLFYALNSDKLRSGMAHFLMSYGQQRNAEPFVDAVFHKWSELLTRNKSIPLVHPNDVFDKPEGK